MHCCSQRTTNNHQMPRHYPRQRPPCPAPGCRADLRKHDTVAGVQRYRCPVCHVLVKPGKSADWVALAGEVLAGSSLADMAEHMGADADTVRLMLAAWARRSSERGTRQPAGPGQGWWLKTTGNYTVGVGVMRGGSPRIVGWSGGPTVPDTPPLHKALVHNTGSWVRSLVAAGSDPSEVADRLWVAMARTNAWRLG